MKQYERICDEAGDTINLDENKKSSDGNSHNSEAT